MLTSTISAAMMGGVGHGHMGEMSHHVAATTNTPCEQTVSTHSAEADIHCVASTHNHSTPPGQVDENSENTMMLCSVCVLCSSVIPALDIDLSIIGRAIQGYASESTSLLSKFPTRLERPPRA